MIGGGAIAALALVSSPCVTRAWEGVEVYYVVPDSHCVRAAKHPGPIRDPKYFWWVGRGCLVSAYDSRPRAAARRRLNPKDTCRRYVPGTEPKNAR